MQAGETERGGGGALADAPADPSRVIIHLDLDCFYAAVEARRLGLPDSTPLAVRQWGGLIAVSYAARAAGVSRFQSIPAALAACPALVLVHVPTIGPDGAVAPGTVLCGESAAELAAHLVRAAGPGGNAAAVALPEKQERKACLELYRASSRAVMATLRDAIGGGCVMQEASIDEAYVDATPAVDGLLGGPDPAAAAASLAAEAGAAPGGWTVGRTPLDPAASVFDARLSAGAALASRWRRAVALAHGYGVSAGVAHCKLVAKVASAARKPASQTVVPARAVPVLLGPLPLSKLPGFGGKLGEAVGRAVLEARGQAAAAGGDSDDPPPVTVGEVLALPFPALLAALGGDAARAAAVRAAAAGVDDSPVIEKAAPKSLLSAKSFAASSSPAALAGWIGVLAGELAARLAADGRRARVLVLTWRAAAHRAAGDHGSGERSVRGPMPLGGGGGGGGGLGPPPPTAAAITAAGVALLKKAGPAALPCDRLALSAADFAGAPAAGGAAITRFLLVAGGGGGGGGPGGPGAVRPPAAPAVPPSPPSLPAKAGPLAAFMARGGGGAGAAASAAAHEEEEGGPQAGPPRAAPPEDEKHEGGQGGGDEAAEPPAAFPSDADALAGVDVSEQRRILRDLWIAAQAGKSGGGGGGGSGSGSGGARGNPATAPPKKRAKGGGGAPARGPRQASLGAAFLRSSKK